MKEKKTTTRLRFKDDNGNDFPDWEEKKLGEIAKFSKGKGISKNDISSSGEIECIRYGELYTHYREVINDIISKTNIDKKNLVLSEANDVIIPASGETQIDIATASCVLRSGIALGGDLNIIKTSNNGVFLSYYLNNKKKIDIANLAQGISVVHLYSSQLALLDIELPSLEEQAKIAKFLTAIDEKIENLEKELDELEAYKKGVMQAIFSEDDQTQMGGGKLLIFRHLENIRFKDDNGNNFPDWEQKKLEEMATFYSGGTPLTTNKEYYGGTIPFIKSGEINSIKTEQFITEEGLKNSSSKLVEVGDILYALYGATSGEVCISKINGAINQAILCIKSTESHQYIHYYLRLQKENIISTFLQGGQGNLSANIIKNLEIPFPCIAEQNKIANFLSAIDEKIYCCTEQISKTEQYKKGLLQQMFI